MNQLRIRSSNPRAISDATESSRCGFTVIEMLVVLALSATLLTALMGVTTILIGYRQTLSEKYPDRAWKNRLEERIRHDICNSREYKVSAVSLELVGYAGRDVVTGSSTLTASNIRYFIKEVAGTPWLVRRETHRQNAVTVSSTELVCQGVTAIRMERLRSARFRTSDYHRQQTEMRMFARLPNRIEVCLYETQSADRDQAPDDRSPETAFWNWRQDEPPLPWVFRVLLR